MVVMFTILKIMKLFVVSYELLFAVELRKYVLQIKLEFCDDVVAYILVVRRDQCSVWFGLWIILWSNLKSNHDQQFTFFLDGIEL